FYDVTMTGFNFHLSDVNIALGLEQLKRLDELNATRRHHAELLTELLAGVEGMHLPEIHSDHVFHLFNMLLDLERLTAGRDDVVRALLAEGIGAGLYYRPIHLFTYFRDRYGTKDGMLPVTESLGERIVTLPLYPLLSDADLEDVAAAIRKVLGHYLR
ncbi:MAG: DegT/DnrJ/EryC1/StrS aminotransferase family protein, partial [Actinobacteria bacterium]|nr:DegT/DnrJ/EryC1/StrS aminotransferase family protein [Actinomycetota bacterium]